MKMLTTTQLLSRIFVCYALGIWFGANIPFPSWVACIAITLYIVVVQFKQAQVHPWSGLVPFILTANVFLLGNIAIQVKLENPIPEKMYGQEVTFYGRISYQPNRAEKWYSTHAVGSAITASGHTVTPKTKFILYTKYNVESYDYKYGTAIVARGTLRQPSGQRNPGGFNYRAYLATQGIHGSIHGIKEIEDTGRIYGHPPLAIAELVRRKIQGILESAYPDHSQVVRAMFLGERKSLDPEVVSQFQNSGTAHILAVSGLHVGMLAGCILLIPWGRFRRTGYGLTIVIVICYAVIIGFRPSIMRATMMCVIFLGARMFGKKPELIDVLFFVATILLLWNPAQLWDVGFQLSFASVGSIVAFMPRWDEITAKWVQGIPERLQRPVRWFLAGIGIAIVAQVGTAILTAYHFNRIPLLGIPIGPFAVGLTGIIMPLILATLIDPIGIAPAINSTVLDLFLSLIRACGEDTSLVWKVKTPSLPFILIYLTFIVYLRNWAWYWLQHGKRMFLPVAAVLLIWFLSMGESHLANRGVLEVTWIDVGQGDSILVKFPNGRSMLLDAGNHSFNQRTDKSWDNGEKTVDPYLSHIGLFKLDVVALSHPDSDHHGGLAHIVNTFNVRNVVGVKPGYSDSFTYRALETAVTAKDVPYTLNGANLDSLSETVSIELLHPHELSKKKNDNSLVIRLTYGGVRILLTGDIERKTERLLVNSGLDIEADFLHVPHHGSKTSSTTAFLDAVNPKFGIISCGVNNKYGHPHSSVVSRYEERGIKLFRTDKQGAITLRTDGKRCWLRTMEDSL